MGDRYLVVRVPEKDVRTLLYGPFRASREITVTYEQELLDLSPEQLRALNLWDEAEVLAQELANPPERCLAAYETGNPEKVCQRAKGHPGYAQDGVGHTDFVRYQGL